MCGRLSLPTVIILASGRGNRFTQSGGAGNKLQAQIMGKTVLQHTLDAVQASGLPWLLEDRGHPGMGDAIAAGVQATLESTEQPTSQSGGWLILPGDLPLIQSNTLRSVAAALREHEVVVPCYQGQRGHPVGFQACCALALLGLHGKQGAASVVLAYAAMHLKVEDVGSLTDVDTVDDLVAAEILMRTRLVENRQNPTRHTD
jgi:molybdenum cofactor cytidylyltransferase